VGEVVQRDAPQVYDYTAFKVNVYTIENILAEKIRTLLERGKVKDYYDVWKLLKVERFASKRVHNLFLQKCQAKGIVFTGIEQFFPNGLLDTLRPHMAAGLTRLTSEPLPSLETIIGELRDNLEHLLR